MVFKKSRPFFLGIEKPPFVVGVLCFKNFRKKWGILGIGFS